MKSKEEMAREDGALQFWLHRWMENAADELAGRALRNAADAQDLRRQAAQLPAGKR